MSNTIKLRSFQPADQPATKLLIQQGLGEHFGFIDKTLNSDLGDIATHYVAHGHTFIVAEDDGRLVGTGALVNAAPGVAQMVRVSVCGDCRRRGVGRAIVARLVEIARQRGCTRVQVETNKDWHDAIGLYRSYGFTEYARDDVSVYLALDIKT